jgi:hypothetical protein
LRKPGLSGPVCHKISPAIESSASESTAIQFSDNILGKAVPRTCRKEDIIQLRKSESPRNYYPEETSKKKGMHNGQLFEIF